MAWSLGGWDRSLQGYRMLSRAGPSDETGGWAECLTGKALRSDYKARQGTPVGPYTGRITGFSVSLVQLQPDCGWRTHRRE